MQFPAAVCVPAGVVDEVTVGEVPGAVVVVVAPVGMPALAPVLALVDGGSLVLAVVEDPVLALPVAPALVPADVALMLPLLVVPAPAFALLVGEVPAGHGFVVAEVLPVAEVAPDGTTGELLGGVVEPCVVYEV